MKTSSSQLLASGLRASTLALRFGLMFYLARSLPLAAVGLFGLYWAGLQLASSLLTLDVYAHTARLFLKPQADRSQIAALHLGFILLASALLSPLAALAFYASSASISIPLLVLFLFHLPIEIISTDVGRLLLPLQRPLYSNVVLFVRSALWVIPLVLVIELDVMEVDVVTIIWFWLLGSVLGALLSLAAMRDALGAFVRPALSLAWIKAGLMGSGAFLAATLLFRSILGADRFIVERILGIEAVGVYALFASVCLGVLGLIESGVSAWHYPVLVKHIQARERGGALRTLGLFFKQNLYASIGLMAAISVGFTAATNYLLAPVYWENIGTFYVLAAGVLMYCLSMPFHYVIYGFGRDRIFIAIYGAVLLVSLLWALLFMKQFGVLGAGIMLALALKGIALGRMLAGCLLLRNLPDRV